MRVKIWPDFGKEVGQGGIKRVNEALHKWLPEYGVEIVDDIEEADVVNVHADRIKTTKPVAYSSHGLYWKGYDWPAWALDANTKLINAVKHANAFSVPSSFVHNVFARGMRVDPFILRHGVEIEEWEPEETHNYVFWGKTRIDSICDPEPVNKLAELCPEIGFVSTFGNDDLPNITTTGRVTYERSKSILKHAGIYLATVKETGAITVLEAMASGIPPVGFRWGVNPEIIEHGVTGWLVDPGDYEGLREGLYYCLSNRDTMGENARQAVIERFQWKDRIRDYLPFYDRALNGINHNRPTVSVIVTAYNLEKYLPACLDSVLRQDFDSWECIIVDDASPDNCGKIADTYASKDRRFSVIHNRQNLYLAASRGQGIQSSQGKYLFPLDADDELGEGALRILSEALDQDHTLDIAFGGFELIEPNGRRWVSTWPPNNPSYEQQIKGHNQLPYASMYRREWWERVGGYKRRWQSAEDASFWTEIMSYGAVPAKVTEIPTLIYNNRPTSMSHAIPTPDWLSWCTWSRIPENTPFGASGSLTARPVHDYDPVEVSVVIPCGPDHDQYLPDALDSLVAQTFINWEAIVINDSGERWFSDSGERLNPYIMGYPFVTWIDGDKNEGVSVARNKGIKASKGKYVLFLDSDDFLQPLAIELLLQTVKTYGGWAYGDWLDQDGTYKESQDFSIEDALQKMPCSITCLFSKDDLELIGGFDEKAPGWEDWDLMLSLLGRDICPTKLRYGLFTYRYLSGTRREENYTREKELLKWIHAKHKKLYEECT